MNSNPVPEYLDANFPALLSTFPEAPSPAPKPPLLTPVHSSLNSLGILGRSGHDNSPMVSVPPKPPTLFNRNPERTQEPNAIDTAPQVAKLSPTVSFGLLESATSASPEISPLAILSSIADDPTLKNKLAAEIGGLKGRRESGCSEGDGDEESDSNGFETQTAISDEVFLEQNQQPINLSTSSSVKHER